MNDELIRVTDEEPEFPLALMSPTQLEDYKKLYPDPVYESGMEGLSVEATGPAMTAETFAELATEAAKPTTIRCNRCEAIIPYPLDPKQKWVCRQCKEHHDYKILRRPRTFYSNKEPYVKPKTDAPKGKAARKAAKRRKREERNGSSPYRPSR
jgi:hypothetical protein